MQIDMGIVQHEGAYFNRLRNEYSATAYVPPFCYSINRRSQRSYDVVNAKIFHKYISIRKLRRIWLNTEH